MPDTPRLEAFAGTWHKVGRALDSPFGPAAAVTAVERFEWLPGGRFLVHRLDGRLGEAEMACIEILGADEQEEGYFAHTYYNDGRQNRWQVEEDGGTWTFRTELTFDGKPFEVRCRMVFEDGGNRLTQKWEYSGGSGWRLFWDTVLTRA
ncbi:MAG TPA: DUF1579 family protein [Longimicrobiaceae bacterium]|nr:DUF1579 family protein [Longimicrobiaceae bacterium]